LFLGVQVLLAPGQQGSHAPFAVAIDDALEIIPQYLWDYFSAVQRGIARQATEMATFGVGTGLILTGTIAAVVFAYVVRFLAVSLNAVEAGMARISPSLDWASRTLGAGQGRTFAKIHAPLLSGGLLTAFLITFVDIMKELPATLILRPFNFDTLAIRANRLASDERLAEASVPSLMIVAVGLVPVVLLSRQIARTQRFAGEAAGSGDPPDAIAEVAQDAAKGASPVEPAASAAPG